MSAVFGAREENYPQNFSILSFSPPSSVEPQTPFALD